MLPLRLRRALLLRLLELKFAHCPPEAYHEKGGLAPFEKVPKFLIISSFLTS